MQQSVLEIKNFSLGLEIDRKTYSVLKDINFSFLKVKFMRLSENRAAARL